MARQQTPRFETPIGDKLSAYVDGELSEAERLEVEAYIAENPDAARFVADCQRLDRGLHELFDRHLHRPLSQEQESLLLELERERTRVSGGRAWPRRARWMAMAAAVVLALVSGGWLAAGLFTQTPPGQSLIALFEEAPGQEERSVGESAPEAAVALYSEDPGTQVDTAADGGGGEDGVNVPDFSDLGFTLIGARMLDSDERDSMQLTYQSEDKSRVELFFAPGADDAGQSMTLMEEGPVAVMAWHNGGRSYSLIGEAERETLLEMGRIVNQEWTVELPSPDDGADQGQVPDQRGGDGEEEAGDDRTESEAGSGSASDDVEAALENGAIPVTLTED